MSRNMDRDSLPEDLQLSEHLEGKSELESTITGASDKGMADFDTTPRQVNNIILSIDRVVDRGSVKAVIASHDSTATQSTAR